ncbi:MAG: hopanoid-associated sugar epimerase [Rhizomicrobium sp.]
MGDSIFITGASGFVGSAIARIALQRGFHPRLLVRATSRRDNITGLDAEICVADMADEDALAAAMKGARYCIHAAADYRLWARDPEEIVRHNREGTRAVMAAALKAGVERVVYTSSVATLHPNEDGTPVDETHRHTPESAIGAYKRSKVVAERVVEEMVAQDGLPAIIVNPSTPIGPRDIKPTPTGRIIVEAAAGRIPAFIETGLNLAHVDDVAEGHFLALEKGRIGQSYILGGQDVAFRDMVGEVARLAGRKAPTIALPRTPLLPLAYAAEMVARFTGKEPFITVDGLKMARYHMFFSSAKAASELGYHARSYTAALKDAYDWFDMAGYIK